MSKVNQQKQPETLEGCVVDIACICSYPQEELVQRAEVHTKECALMGHYVESGYGLVNTNCRISILDPKATPKVVETLQSGTTEKGIYLKAERETKRRKNGNGFRAGSVTVTKYGKQRQKVSIKTNNNYPSCR